MIQIVRKRTLDIYVAKNGQIPFVQWLESLSDRSVRAIIKERLDRVALGNFGDWKTVGRGVKELRVPVGPGYRVYFGEVNEKVVLLFCGGDKSSQQRDVKKAQLFWKNYLGK